MLLVTDDGRAAVVRTQEFTDTGTIRFATQSGPMLPVDGAINPVFTEGSQNVHIRNGVGIRPDGSVLFAISTEPVNFYDFAEYFRSHGCRNALYLDGFVSRLYVPEQDWEQVDGDVGVLIGVTE